MTCRFSPFKRVPIRNVIRRDRIPMLIGRRVPITKIRINPMTPTTWIDKAAPGEVRAGISATTATRARAATANEQATAAGRNELTIESTIAQNAGADREDH